MPGSYKTIELLRQAGTDIGGAVGAFAGTPQERVMKAKLKAQAEQRAGMKDTAGALSKQVQTFAQSQPDLPAAQGEMPALTPQKEMALDLVTRLNSTNYDIVKEAINDGHQFFKDSIDKQTQPTLTSIEGEMTKLGSEIQLAKANGKKDSELADQYKKLRSLQHAVSDTIALRASARINAEEKAKDPTKQTEALKAFFKMQAGGQLEPNEQMLVMDMFSGMFQAGAQAGLFTGAGMKGYKSISNAFTQFSNQLGSAQAENPGIKPGPASKPGAAVQPTMPSSQESLQDSLLNNPLFDDIVK